ncbi:hypothetical protein D3C81_835870 [compost metagenome]
MRRARASWWAGSPARAAARPRRATAPPAWLNARRKAWSRSRPRTAGLAPPRWPGGWPPRSPPARQSSAGSRTRRGRFPDWARATAVCRPGSARAAAAAWPGPVRAVPSPDRVRRACRTRAGLHGGAGYPAWRCPRAQWLPPGRIPECSRASATARAGAADAPRSATRSLTSLPVYSGADSGALCVWRTVRDGSHHWCLTACMTPMLPCCGSPVLLDGTCRLLEG